MYFLLVVVFYGLLDDVEWLWLGVLLDVIFVGEVIYNVFNIVKCYWFMIFSFFVLGCIIGLIRVLYLLLYYNNFFYNLYNLYLIDVVVVNG